MRWKAKPEGSTWGLFGDDDQRGRLNLLTNDKILQGIAEVRAGRAFCLSLPLDLPGGQVLNVRRGPPEREPTYRDGVPVVNFPFSRLVPGATDIVSDDSVKLALQYSTQWDSLAHVGSRFDADGDGDEEFVYYNGFRANVAVRGPLDYESEERGGSGQRECGGPYGALALGIQNLAEPPVQGRGVLVDLATEWGRGRKLIGWKELRAAMVARDVEVEAGDILLLYTGFADAVAEMDGTPQKDVLDATGAVLNGRDPDLLHWISDSGVSAIAADNYAVEAHPYPEGGGPGPAMPLHHHCLFRLGVPLGELWWLRDLADWLRENNRSRFLLTAPALRLPGAFGSPLTPVATV